MTNITVIMNSYKRPQSMREQYDSIINQSIKNVNIMCWCNNMNNLSQNTEIFNNIVFGASNINLGVWARFAYALNAPTKYICIIDDDTILGKRWLENCLETMKIKEGLLGCRGVRMIGDDYKNYPGCKYESILGNENIEQVDIMGHCWFFKRDWLRAYWAEMPPVLPPFGGEDMHFSYAIQKHLGLNTYVPPQPESDKEMWGSLNPSKYGEDMAATSRTQEGYVQANQYWNYILSQGYKLVKDKK